jgi:hypothetical protein
MAAKKVIKLIIGMFVFALLMNVIAFAKDKKSDKKALKDLNKIAIELKKDFTPTINGIINSYQQVTYQLETLGNLLTQARLREVEKRWNELPNFPIGVFATGNKEIIDLYSYYLPGNEYWYVNIYSLGILQQNRVKRILNKYIKIKPTYARDKGFEVTDFKGYKSIYTFMFLLSDKNDLYRFLSGVFRLADNKKVNLLDVAKAYYTTKKGRLVGAIYFLTSKNGAQKLERFTIKNSLHSKNLLEYFITSNTPFLARDKNNTNQIYYPDSIDFEINHNFLISNRRGLVISKDEKKSLIIYKNLFDKNFKQ